MSPFGVFVIGIAMAAGLTVLMRNRIDRLIKRYDDIITVGDYPGEEIIGEEKITENNWNQIALRHIDELVRVLTSADNWTDDFENNIGGNRKLLVQSKKVSGIYAVEKTPLTRAIWNVQRCNDQKLFDFLMGVEGFAIIDPVTSNFTFSLNILLFAFALVHLFRTAYEEAVI